MSQKKITELWLELVQRKPYLQTYIGKTNPNLKLQKAREPNEFYIEFESTALASKISPKKQAERLISEKKISRNDIILILGLGNPHLPKLVSDSLRDGQIVILIDEHPEVPELLLEEFLFGILDKQGRHIFSSELHIELLWTYLESLPIERITGIKIFKNQSNIQKNPEYYQSIEEKFGKLFSSKMSDLLTRFEFERLWVKNTISNTIEFKLNSNRFKVSDLWNGFVGRVAVLVSAGPSLRSQVEWIKTNREKLFVFSCDTSIKVLLKFGVIPDGVMTLDAQTNSYFHFMGETLSEIPLFADLVTSPRLIRSLKFKSIIFSQTAKFLVDASGKPFRLATAGGETSEKWIGNVGDVQSGGSVATSAFDLLKNLGFQKIFLVGQDLAYTGREIHSTGTHHNEKWLTLVNRKQSLEKINEVIVRKRETKYVESSDGGTVLTDYVLSVYRNWFEESIKSISIEVYNISNKGAKIEGIASLNLEEAQKIIDLTEKHEFFWKDFPEWKASGKKEITSIDIKKQILEEIESFQKKLEEITQDIQDVTEIDAILEILKEYPYLEAMVRKTLIYLNRNSQNLNVEKQKELLLSSLWKEIFFLKRGIFTAGI
ncbi:MAG: 6-hydroxymethylpterin diphosphokinase MptE-like protein [Leptospiraceae bacterium]|nr:6-hydroxymethylpterin diphosphokinase MptE-like protein [Leptospiraceae bacterium]